LNRLYREDADEETILAALGPMFSDYAKSRRAGETFGDFVTRLGVV
jgi:sulfite reductase (NADPH) hemoprotein beta-component